MSKINILPKQVYNRISAGEVVERPSSIVKELFENSIDAGAKNITVYIENGGINSIVVEDDGCGIEKDDIESVFMPHATSKISKAEDLNCIETLGFRGEAMSSISSVSKVTLVTKTAQDEIGSKIVVEGGELVDKSEQQCETGTTITVLGIFYNTPARLKFLKLPKSEESEVTALMEKLILSNPMVAVKYYVNSKMVFQSYGDGLKNAMISIYGKSVIDNCCEISTIKNGIKIDGFLGNINYVKANKTYQTLIVNGRYVTDNTVASAIHNAYSTYLMKRQYPFYVISLTVPSEVVDVNVHPRKAEVRFSNNQIIYSSIYSVVVKVVDGSSQVLDVIKESGSSRLVDDKVTKLQSEQINPVSQTKSTLNDIFCESSSFNSTYQKPTADEKTDSLVSFSSTKLREIEPKKYVNENGEIVYKSYDKTIYQTPNQSKIGDHRQIEADFTNDEFLASLKDSDKTADEIFAENKKFIESIEDNCANSTQQSIKLNKHYEFLGQVFDTYLIFADNEDLLLLDQHAGHERINYDKMLLKVKQNKVVRQQLLIPYCITVNAEEHQMIFDLMDYLSQLGFDIEIYGDNSFRIFTVPNDLVGMDIEAFFYDIISDSEFKREKVPLIIKEQLMQKACKASIKAGFKLDLSEIDCLLAQIDGDLGLKCPHGRPVFVRISKKEVEKWFKRIV